MFIKTAEVPLPVAAVPELLRKRAHQSQVFFVKREHQPCGLISPSTVWQALGGWKKLHASQCWLSFGLSWYDTVLFVTLACAVARFDPRLWMIAAPAPEIATRCRKTRRERSFVLLGMDVLHTLLAQWNTHVHTDAKDLQKTKLCLCAR